MLVFLFLTNTNSFAQDSDLKEFILTDVSNNERLSLLSLKDKKGIVLLFISNDCPYAQYYQDRIRKMVNAYEEKGISFILINSHLDNTESPSSMKRMWDTWNIDIPYLADKEQTLKRRLGVEKSPTAVILKPLQEGFSVYYSGMIDNNPQVAGDVKEAYLLDNLSTLLASKPPAHRNNRAIGCMIR